MRLSIYTIILNNMLYGILYAQQDIFAVGTLKQLKAITKSIIIY